MSLNLKEQIPKLFDDKAFIEIFSSVRQDESEDNLVCGSGKIGGSLVYFFAQNGSIKNIHVIKLIKLFKLVLKNPAPLIGFYNASGMDMSSGIDLLNDYGQLLHLQAKLSGKVLSVSVIGGKCIGINAIMAHGADVVLMSDNAELYPTPIEQTIDKNIGGAKINAQLGIVQAVVDGSQIMNRTRTIVDLLVNPKIDDLSDTQSLSDDLINNLENFSSPPVRE